MLRPNDLEVAQLGSPTRLSPLNLSTVHGDGLGDFVKPNARIRYQLDPDPDAPGQDLAFQVAGPRERIYFDPQRATAAIVTCGGLCPGLNNVIRSLFLELRYNYGVDRIFGIRHGYLGLNPESGLEPLPLTEDSVSEVHKLGGTMLGTSRGPQRSEVIVDFLESRGINLLFCVGGDGTQRGAYAIAEEVTRRDRKIAVVGIPKTIDNDITYVYRTFGYATALEVARDALRCAHTEAKAAINGIGLVKLMGRHAGFITAGAALASQEANFVLVPEVRFPLEGEDGLLHHLEQRLAAKPHALIALAEGAGQHLFAEQQELRDASGNLLHHDIGVYLKQRIGAHFADRQIPVSLKYIDPSYLIRSVPANTQDRLLSDQMARFAAHAAMAGHTNLLIGLWNNRFVHVPISTAVETAKQMDVEGDLWTNVLLATGQPRWR